MSSHHFVKEDQEPALVIADASAIPFSVVQELLEWSPTVIVLAKALPDVLLWGIKIDVVISELEYVKQQVELLSDQAPVKVLSHQPEENPLLTALYFLTAGKYRAVNVVGVPMEALKSFTDHIDVVTFVDKKRWSYVKNGRFEKWLTKGSWIIPSVESEEILLEGLDENYRTVQDGLVSIRADSPFWLGEEF